MSGDEVQKHGFTWEDNLRLEVYGATPEDLPKIKYTGKFDLPAEFNRIGNFDLSIKTTGSPNTVCMGEPLRIFDAVSSGRPFHLTVVFWDQVTPTTKRLTGIVEVNLTNSRELLFGSLARNHIDTLADLVHQVPQKCSPTPQEHSTLYEFRDALQPSSGALLLNIKCNSQQSRLQCSFNQFQRFLKKNPDRIVAQSTTPQFRGKTILEEVASGPRVFKTAPAPDSALHSPPI